ncbi:MAG: molybdate ABC transporter substrate-binding protein [Pseudanabaena sp. CAN_BIN31]|nr:molybdate ABC transporter substrate-binding protein [Pseudanabaena sp. CAN_BIN31]
MKKYQWLFLSLFLVGLLAACGISSRQNPITSAPAVPKSAPITLTISAAANLNSLAPEIGKLWEQQTGHKALFNLGATTKLAQQIEQGAAVDLFAAANKKAIEDLDQKGLIISETKRVYAIGAIGTWQRQDSPIKIKTLQDLLNPKIKRIAIANPATAPYGIAAREALQSAGIWEQLQPQIILGENITQAQQYVETGNVDVAIVALANTINKSGKWTAIDSKLHKPLEQMLAIPKNVPHPKEAKQFADLIASQKVRALIQKYGYLLPLESESR